MFPVVEKTKVGFSRAWDLLRRRLLPTHPKETARLSRRLLIVGGLAGLVAVFFDEFRILFALTSVVSVLLSKEVERWTKLQIYNMITADVAAVREDFRKAVGASHDDSGQPFISVSIYDSAGLGCLIDASTGTVEDLRYRDGIALNELRPGASANYLTLKAIRQKEKMLFRVRFKVNEAFSEELHIVVIRLLGDGVPVSEFSDLRPRDSSEHDIVVPGAESAEVVAGQIMVLEKASGATLSSLQSATVVPSR